MAKGKKLRLTMFSIDWKETWSDYRDELIKLDKKFPYLYEADQGFVDSQIAFLTSRALTRKEKDLLYDEENIMSLFDTPIFDTKEYIEGNNLSDIIKKAQKAIDEMPEEE